MHAAIKLPMERFTLYVKGKFVKPPELKCPDVRSLVQIGTKPRRDKSEVMCNWL